MRLCPYQSLVVSCKEGNLRVILQTLNLYYTTSRQVMYRPAVSLGRIIFTTCEVRNSRVRRGYQSQKYNRRNSYSTGKKGVKCKRNRYHSSDSRSMKRIKKPCELNRAKLENGGTFLRFNDINIIIFSHAVFRSFPLTELKAFHKWEPFIRMGSLHRL